MKKQKPSQKKGKKKTKEDNYTPKRLYRSNQDKIISGVCGGIAEYFNIDPVWVRLIAVLLFLAEGVGLIIYIIAWILIPQNPNQVEGKKTVVEKTVNKFHEKHKANMKNHKERKGKCNRPAHIFGLGLVLIGSALLLDNLFIWFDFHYLWPVLIILFGISIIFRRSK